MSDYTPTTGEIRGTYVDNRISERVARAEFDRWLAKVKADAWDEGAADGVWNHEHQAMIERGNRERIDNPYREVG